MWFRHFTYKRTVLWKNRAPSRMNVDTKQDWLKMDKFYVMGNQMSCLVPVKNWRLKRNQEGGRNRKNWFKPPHKKRG